MKARTGGDFMAFTASEPLDRFVNAPFALSNSPDLEKRVRVDAVARGDRGLEGLDGRRGLAAARKHAAELEMGPR